MYGTMRTPDSINLRYSPIAEESDDTRVSFHTKDNSDLSSLFDYILPNKGEVVDVDVMEGNTSNVVVDFSSRKEMIDFLELFATNQLEKRREHLKEYYEQKKSSVF